MERNKKRKLGDCYQSAARYVLDCSKPGVFLVHGRPTLQVAPFQEYGHAWVEFEKVWPGAGKVWMVRDTERQVELPRDAYYALGQVDPSKCFRYDLGDVRQWLQEMGHWGPWEGPDAVGSVFGKDEEEE